MTSVSGYLRQEAILNRLRQDSSVDVGALMRELRVSYATVARDLAELERRAALRRVRGGAIRGGTEYRPGLRTGLSD